ncbi:hypothetical protein WJX73_010915 [Symbiochloris irregularis]|uniref:Uncharacterized protein n=1 Tax=Symbiochloris irregularis TaxID=706552 RepID=A0AAW1NR58_9CHLO
MNGVLHTSTLLRERPNYVLHQSPSKQHVSQSRLNNKPGLKQSSATESNLSSVTARASRQSAQEGTEATAVRPPAQDGNISGIWLKDEKASDMKAYERSLTHCMRMGSMEKETAMRLFEGMEVKHDSQGVKVSYLTVVPFFQVQEHFSFSQSTTMKRRDARPGAQTAEPAMALHGGVAMVLSWPPPLSGTLQDLFTLEGTDGQTLHVRSLINVEGRTNETLQVFRKADEWKPRYSWPFGSSR